MKSIKSQNIIMLDNSYYDYVNSFGVLEERLFYFICNKYRMLYNDFSMGGYNEKIKEQDENYNIIIFNIIFEDFHNEIKHLKLNTHIINLMKLLPSKIIKTYPNKNIESLSLFEYIKYDVENKNIEIKITKTFLNVIKLKNFDEGNFFKIYYDDFKKIKGKHTKKIYRLCSRYVNQKYLTMNIEILKNYFLIPPTYRMTHIDRLLKSSILELETKTNFKVTYNKTKENKKVKYINFNFGID